MYYDTVEVKGETKNLTFAHKGFFFLFLDFCQKNTKHSDLNLKKSHKNLHTDVYSGFIHNCQNLEATKMSFSR